MNWLPAPDTIPFVILVLGFIVFFWFLVPEYLYRRKNRTLDKALDPNYDPLMKRVTTRELTLEAPDGMFGTIRLDDNEEVGAGLGIPIAMTVTDRDDEQIFLSLSETEALKLAIYLQASVMDIS